MNAALRWLGALAWGGLLGAGPVAARPIAIVVGASASWTTCDGAPCKDPTRRLGYADDDALRAAFLLQMYAAPQDIHVLTTLDEESRARPLAGRLDGPAEGPVILDLVRRVLTDESGGPHDLILYLSAHGTEATLALDDAPYDAANFRDRLFDAVPPGARLTLISDACYSGAWKDGSADGLAGLRVEASPRGILEVAVGSPTPQRPRVASLLSYWVLSGLVGAADADGDGRIVAQEMADQLEMSRWSADAAVLPVVRAPGGRADAPFPKPRADEGVELRAQTPTRWVLSNERGWFLVEAFTSGRETRRLRLPPGIYAVFEIPYVASGDRWVPASSYAVRRKATVEEGRWSTPSADAALASLDLLKSGDAGEDSDLLGLTLGPLWRLPPDDVLAHADLGGRVEAGVAASVGTLGTHGVLVGPMLAWTFHPLTHDLRWRLSLGASLGLGDGLVDGVDARQATVKAGLTRSLLDRGPFSVGLGGGLGATGVGLEGPDVRQGTLGPLLFAQAGITARPGTRRWLFGVAAVAEAALLVEEGVELDDGTHALAGLPALDGVLTLTAGYAP